MKLQLNATGAWRNTVEFDERFMASVQREFRQVVLYSRGRLPTLRITDDQGTVLYYCDGADYEWRPA